MKRKSLLFLLLMALFAPWAAQAQETLMVHDGNATNGNVPVYGFYADAYLKCEMVYPAAELGDMEDGTITGMTFYASTPADDSWGSANFQVFLTEVADATISAYVGPGTVVYEGALDGTQSEMTITFTTPYDYNGGNLLVGVYNTATGSYKSITWAGEEVTGASITGYSYSSLDDVSAAQRNFLPKTTFTYTPGEVIGCGKPKQLAVNYTGGNTATVTWTGDATLYNIDVNGTVTNNVTSPYTLTNLEFGTTYAVKVQANCDGDLSDFTSAVNFTTDLCAPENMCEITYELADSYGDGWNGNTLSVVDVATTAVLATWTIPSGGSSASGSLALCDGREIQFVWAGTSWPYENSFTVYDINGEIICQHIKDDVGPAVGILSNYTVSCTASSCSKPTDLAVADVTANTATLRWTENGEATAWIVEVTDLDGGQVTTWNASATRYQIVGLTPGTPYSVRVKPDCDVEKWSDAITFRTEVACPAPTALEVVPTPISATVTWTGDASNYNLRYGTCAGADATLPAIIVFHADDIWQDGSGYQMLLDADATAYGTIIPETGALSMNCSGNEDIYAEFEYKIPANADGSCSTSNVIIDNTITLEIPAGTYDWCITNPTPGDRIWIASAQGNVGGRADDYEFEGGMIYEFNMYMLGSNDATDVNIICDNVNWITTVNNATSPYTINGLDPETEYTLEVQAVCGGEDGESAWTSTSFTTPSNCDAPTALESTDVMPHSATLNWTGYQGSYTVRYRTAAHSEATTGGLFEDFESGSLTTNGWTVLREGEGTEYTDWRIFDGNFSSNPVTAHSGTYLVMGRSWASDAYNVDNWLISPQVALEGQFSYWVMDDGQYHEHYAVYVSTTTTEASAFTLVYEPGDASDVWTQHTVDLRSYAGQQGYIAFRLTDEDQDYLLIDDIALVSVVEVPAGEWKEVEVSALPYTLEGLADATEYEWQVQGINASCDGGVTEWSEIATFTTPDGCADITNLMLDDLTATSMTLSWTGVQDRYLVQYRTAEGLINKTFSDSANEQGDWTTDNLEENSGWDILPGYFTFYYTLNPPQTLISPELIGTAANSTLTFDYVAYSSDYPETFKVGFSTTNNSVGSFTWGDEITTDNSQYFETYSVSVPDGAKYFAIQCTSYDALALILDNFEIGQYAEAGEWNYITVSEPTVTINGLAPETTYEVYVQGICGEDEYTRLVGGYVTTLEQTTVTQVLALGAGVNYVSFYVNTDLDALKAALLETITNNQTITINSQTQNVKYQRGRWVGSLSTLDLSSMYKIEMPQDCEIALEGMPIDLAELPITINGVSWIAYPLNAEMTVTNCFAGFAGNEDQVFSQTQSVKYQRGRWVGQLTTLVPGQGYIYQSAATESRTFVFPTSAKTAPKSVQPAVTGGFSIDMKMLDSTKVNIAPKKAEKENTGDGSMMKANQTVRKYTPSASCKSVKSIKSAKSISNVK